MADTRVPILPTLHANSSPCLKLPENIVAYLLRFMFANPGRTSIFNEGEMLSFRKIEAQYGKDPDALSREIEDALTKAINHYFPEKGYSVVVEVENGEHFETDYDSEGNRKDVLQGNYAIEIAITDKYSVPVVPRSAILVDKTGGTIDCKFVRNKNGQS